MFSKKMSSTACLASLVVVLNLMVMNPSLAANNADPKTQAAIEAKVSEALGTKKPVNLYPMQFNWFESRPQPFYNLVPDDRTGIAAPGTHFSTLADHPDFKDSFEARVAIQIRGDLKTVQVFNGRNELTRGYVVNTKIPESDPKRVLFAMVVDNDSVVTADIMGFPDRIVMGRAEAITKKQALEYKNLLAPTSASAVRSFLRAGRTSGQEARSPAASTSNKMRSSSKETKGKTSDAAPAAPIGADAAVQSALQI